MANANVARVAICVLVGLFEAAVEVAGRPPLGWWTSGAGCAFGDCDDTDEVGLLQQQGVRSTGTVAAALQEPDAEALLEADEDAEAEAEAADAERDTQDQHKAQVKC
mmetsp:Transcript_34626/g.99787  ORF Transcript_34626/g.99787 Transcript_34626/m.99787 type:complete len:107 (-) Transcript_34626:34-354(-)